MKRTMLVFGTIAGVIVSTVMALTALYLKDNYRHFEGSELLGYTSMLLAFSLIFVAVKSYRDRYNNGTITFKNAFLLGLGVATIASALYVITWIFVYNFFFPDFAQAYTQCMIQQMKDDGKSAVDIQAAQKQMAYMFSFYDTWYGMVGITFMEIFPIGLLVALVCAFFLKRSNSQNLVTQHA